MNRPSIPLRFAYAPLAALMALGALTCLPAQAQSPAAANSAAAATADSQATVKALLAAADAAYKAKDWQKAVDGYSQMLAVQPSNARAVRWRGAAYSELGQHELAIADSQKAIDLEPNSVYSHNGLCWSLILANQPAKAQASCVKAQQLDPMNMSATVNIANTYLLQGNKAEAWKWYEQTIGLIDDESDLVEGPLEDFNIFEKRGWQVELVKQARAEFEPKGRQWLNNKQTLDALLEQVTSADVNQGMEIALEIRLRRLVAMEKLLGENHPRVASALVELASWQEVQNSRVAQLQMLGEQANAFMREAQLTKALEVLDQAYVLSVKLIGLHQTATLQLLDAQITLHRTLENPEEVLRLMEQALVISDRVHGTEHPDTGIRLSNLAELYQALAQYAKAEPLLLRAVAISEKAQGPEHPDTGTSLNNLAGLYQALAQYAKAEPLLLRSLAINEKVQGPEHPNTGISLNNLAELYGALGQYAKAEPLYLRALAISEKAQGPEHPDTGNRLNNLAELYRALGQYGKAEPLYLRALTISEKAQGPEHPSTGTRLNNLALLYKDLGHYAKAEPLLLRALDISEKAQGPEHPSTGTRLNNLALLYESLGQYAKAEPLYLRAIVISEKARGTEHPDTGTSLNNLALLYYALGQYAKAEPLYLRALAISEKAQGPEHPSTGTRLNNLAVLFRDLGQYAKAEPLYLRALAISEKAQGPEHPDTGISLNNLALLYKSLGQIRQAEPLYERALRIANAAKKPDLAWTASANLMHLAAPRTPQPDFPRNLPLAIWYGKHSVNALQAVRENLKALDKLSQQSFLDENKSTYEYLADLLIESGRLAESEQVLGLLKAQELKDLTRRSGPVAQQVAYTGPEIAQAKAQNALSQAAVTVYVELEALKARQKQGFDLNAAELARVTELEAKSGEQRKAFQAFMAQLQYSLSADPASAQKERDALEKSARGMQTLLRQAGPGHVGLHYVVTDERLSIIVNLPTTSFGKQTKVSRAELNRHIGQLRQALQDPKLDPQVPAEALYKLLVEPIAPELAQAKAHTLVLSLTDLLRYIPFGVLHDGKKYLVENYAVSLYTPAGGQGIQKTNSKNWQIAGLGLTQATTIADDNNRRFDALPGVGKELASIVRTSASPKGALPGQISLDPQFTKASFEQALPKYPVLHVASHFRFTPGSEHLSYLVLGNGTRLSLADLKDMDFSNVQLLTLSACDTASGGGRNERGSEVEGLGAAVQLAGAKAVLATLWPVFDESTAALMQRFYELRSQDKTNTAMAIQQAQLDMLQGKGTASAAQGAKQRGAAVIASANATGAPAPAQAAALPKLRPYMHDPDKPFAHPYYWAPFILMGNWL